MVLFTVAALAIGLAVVGYAVLQRGGSAPVDDLSPPGVAIPTELADGRTLGRADAPVTVEIWSDFQCPACGLLAERVEPSLIAEHVTPGTARIVYRDAAFQGIRTGATYDESVESAAAARCAADEGKFWQMHAWIFANWDGENQGAYRADRLRAIAQAAGLDMAAYDACMATGDKQVAVRAETADGVSGGINATPTLIINGSLYSGPLSVPEISRAISDAAQAAG